MQVSSGVIMAVMFALALSPAMGSEKKHTVRFGLEDSIPTGDITIFGGQDRDARTTVGPAFGYEYRFTPLFGIEGSIAYFDHDLFDSGTSMTVAEVTLIPLLASANFHIVRKERFDLHLGAQLGYVLVGDSEFKSGESVDNDNDLAFGLGLGFDVPFAERWMFSTSVRWLGIDVQQTGRECDPFWQFVLGTCVMDEVDVDPIVIRVGMGVRF